MLIKEQKKIIQWSWLNIFNVNNLYFIYEKKNYAVFKLLITVSVGLPEIWFRCIYLCYC